MQEVSNQNIDQPEILAFFEAYKKRFVSTENYQLFDAHKEQFINYYTEVYSNAKPDIEDISTLAPFIIKFIPGEFSYQDTSFITLKIEEYLKKDISKNESFTIGGKDPSHFQMGASLFHACKLGLLDLVKLILKLDPLSIHYRRSSASWETVFHGALKRDRKEIFKLLVEQGRILHTSVRPYGSTLVSRFLQKNETNEETANILLNLTALGDFSLDIRNFLHDSASLENTELFKSILIQIQQTCDYDANAIRQQGQINLAESIDTEVTFPLDQILNAEFISAIHTMEKLSLIMTGEIKLMDVLNPNYTVHLPDILQSKVLENFKQKLWNNCSLTLISTFKLIDIIDKNKIFKIDAFLNTKKELKLADIISSDMLTILEPTLKPRTVNSKKVIFPTLISGEESVIYPTKQDPRYYYQESPFLCAARYGRYANMKILRDLGAEKPKLSTVIALYEETLTKIPELKVERLKMLNFMLISGHIEFEEDDIQKIETIYLSKSVFSDFNPLQIFQNAFRQVIELCCLPENKDYLGMSALQSLKKRLDDSTTLLHFLATHKAVYVGSNKDNTFLTEIIKTINTAIDSLLSNAPNIPWQMTRDIMQAEVPLVNVTQSNLNMNSQQ